MFEARSLVGTHDLLFVTLDTLRFDVAAEELEAGRTPCLASMLPGRAWEARHSPGTFTYAAHHAFFAGFLPTPASPGRHPRLFAARFAGSETTLPGTWTFDEADLPSALARVGYRTICVGGVGFFNKRTALGRVLPSLFAESHWEPRMGVTSPTSTEAQVTLAVRLLGETPPSRRVFLFVNVAAIHSPNRIFVAGATRDTRETHAAALRYVDTCLPPLFAALRRRGPTLCIVCSDHGTAYGEDDLRGHRVAHPVVWTVPYAEWLLEGGGMNLATLRADPYRGYAYAYPHKTAYRAFEPPRPLADLWGAEDRSRLVLYAHVPVCEMRCGFCNLFTTVGADDDFEARYVATLERQGARARAALGDASFAGAAIGGGTPTFLSTRALARVLGVLDAFGASPARVPTSVETSPRTASPEKLALLRDAGVRRISIGVQSFDEAETRALGRAQKPEWVESALDAIRAAAFPVLNVDLMFGLAGQDERSLLRSIERALAWRPEEIYLYPLYVRPLTGLGRRGDRPADDRLRLYRAARDRLKAAGYEPVSLRFFRHRDAPAGIDTCCQEDGTVGLGCGARSYTRRVHYASDWAVGSASVRAILEAYLAAPDASFDVAAYGVELSREDERRRYVLKTLLRRDGLPLDAYEAWFASRAEDDFPELATLVSAGLAERTGDRVALSEEGLALSDAIGPLFYSEGVRSRMMAFELR